MKFCEYGFLIMGSSHTPISNMPMEQAFYMDHYITAQNVSDLTQLKPHFIFLPPWSAPARNVRPVQYCEHVRVHD